MDYEAILSQVVALLQRERRIAYRVLKRRLQLDDDLLEDLKDDLIYAKKLASDEEGKVLVWAGTQAEPSPPSGSPSPEARPPKPNAASSRCCSATWWTRPCSPASSTRKSCARWCGLSRDLRQGDRPL